MECNKEEAIRARCIAENKMQNKDFLGARKIALKAQQLFPDLDNISQILTVCEVHCSAGVKLNGETDWYGILQVEPTADESLIKKQYRKLALLLHPDKNKFPGAEAAFKLIGEANMTLSDRGKRSLHDLKRSVRTTASTRQPSQQPNRASYAKKQPGFANNVPNMMRSNGNNQQQPSAFSGGHTFWTICPDCGMRYQYYKSILNRALRCQNCLKPFIAYDLNAQAMPPGSNLNQAGHTTQEFSGQHSHNVGQKSNFGSSIPSAAFQGSGRSATSEAGLKSRVNEVGGGSVSNGKDGKINDRNTNDEMKFERVELKEDKKREQAEKPSTGTSHKKARKVVVESSEDTDGTASEEEVMEGVEITGGQNNRSTCSNPRRSARLKQNVTYKEESGDDDEDDNDHNKIYDVDDDEDDIVKPPDYKRLKKSGGSSSTREGDAALFGVGSGVKEQTHATVASEKKNNKQNIVSARDKLPNGGGPMNKNEIRKAVDAIGKEEEVLRDGSGSTVDFSSKPSPDLDNFSYPDPEFYDFEKDRDANKFAVDQIWAIYDELDGMPRYYARIRKVSTPNFELRYTWLEHDPVGEAEIAWSNGELPVACGNFRHGKSDKTQDRTMFSHLMLCDKGSQRNTYHIHPRKGEVWALFKGWDIRWSSNSGNQKVYQYEVVEVLSDYTQGRNANVVHLVKINGFVGLFKRAVDDGTATLKIPSGELLRFSHRVPSYRMSGNEREGVPEGSFELDYASLPSNFGDIAPSVSLDSATARSHRSVVGREIHKDNLDPGSTMATDMNSMAQAKMSRDSQPVPVNGPDMVGCTQRSSEQDAAAQADAAAEVWRQMDTKPTEHKHPIDEMNKDSQGTNSTAAARQQNASTLGSSSPNCYEYPDSEFYSFDEERSSAKFQRGQIWALYSDIDKYPKYYGWIKKVELEKFTVHVTWLESCPAQEAEQRWLAQELPISCGRFKVAQEVLKFESTDVFSHLIQAAPAGKKDQFNIYPNKGEVWAVYKNWHFGWTQTDLENCNYDVVEILGPTASGLEAQLLVKVDGYRAVFRPERSGVSTKLVIRVDEYVRFSHQIPAFKLTEEQGGELRGFWELDPASVPDVLLFAS